MEKFSDFRDELLEDPEIRAGYEEQSQLVRFGRMVRAARESKALTQAALAAKLAISQSEISRLEKGEGVMGPSLDRIVAVAHALDLQLVVGFMEPTATARRPERGTRSTFDPPEAIVQFARIKRQRRAQKAGVLPEESEPLWSAF
ncbi:MAG: helix-turn-helix domain-containing protein [Janthinobacterium lividum]